jgi:regulation of enolase protein 1 (concanavalin A-like superfamily)
LSFALCNWLNPPSIWELDGERLCVTTDNATDFWRETHYGFIRDNGHFFAQRVHGDFSAQFRVRACYEVLYDQAGIMVRLNERSWIKAGVEISDGRAQLGSVLTSGQSDWATGSYTGDPTDFWIRASVREGVVRVQASTDGKKWPLVRLAPFPRAEFYHVGPMCCTPERAGLTAHFSEFVVTPPLERNLDDLA